MALAGGRGGLIASNTEEFARTIGDLLNNPEMRAELGMGDRGLLVVQPTRVVPRKGIELAIELVGRLRENWSFWETLPDTDDRVFATVLSCRDAEEQAESGRSREQRVPAPVETAATPLNRRERRALERTRREAGGMDEMPEHDERVDDRKAAKSRAERPAGDQTSKRRRDDRSTDAPVERESRPSRPTADEDVETYRIEVGHAHGVKPNNIVGAIANEAGLEGRHIGRVVIRDDHSFVDLPAGMPKDVFRQLQKVRVAGQPLQISRALKSHVEKLRRERPSAAKFKGKPQRGAQRGRRK